MPDSIFLRAISLRPWRVRTARSRQGFFFFLSKKWGKSARNSPLSINVNVAPGRAIKVQVKPRSIAEKTNNRTDVILAAPRNLWENVNAVCLFSTKNIFFRVLFLAGQGAIRFWVRGPESDLGFWKLAFRFSSRTVLSPLREKGGAAFWRKYFCYLTKKIFLSQMTEKLCQFRKISCLSAKWQKLKIWKK